MPSTSASSSSLPYSIHSQPLVELDRGKTVVVETNPGVAAADRAVHARDLDNVAHHPIISRP